MSDEKKKSKEHNDEHHHHQLTFRPEVDNREQLTGFLRQVQEQYLSQRSRHASSHLSEDRARMPPPEPEIPSVASNLHNPLQDSSIPSKSGGAVQTSLEPDGKTTATSKPTAAAASPKLDSLGSPEKPVSPTKRGKTPKDDSSEDLPRKKKKVGRPKGGMSFDLEKQMDAINRGSLFRASSIDIYAPDPEQFQAPPNETPVEKRRRMERVNGRRKRARRLIELDTLHEQWKDLMKRNQELEKENQGFRDKIAEIKRAQVTGEHVNVDDILGKKDSKPAAAVAMDDNTKSAAVDSTTIPGGLTPASANAAQDSLPPISGPACSVAAAAASFPESYPTTANTRLPQRSSEYQPPVTLVDSLHQQQHWHAGISGTPGLSQQQQLQLLPRGAQHILLQQHQIMQPQHIQQHQITNLQQQEWQILSSILPTLSQAAAEASGQSQEQIMSEATSLLQSQRQTYQPPSLPSQQVPQQPLYHYSRETQGGGGGGGSVGVSHQHHQQAPQPQQQQHQQQTSLPPPAAAAAQQQHHPPPSPPPSNAKELRVWMKRHRERLKEEENNKNKIDK